MKPSNCRFHKFKTTISNIMCVLSLKIPRMRLTADLFMRRIWLTISSMELRNGQRNGRNKQQKHTTREQTGIEHSSQSLSIKSGMQRVKTRKNLNTSIKKRRRHLMSSLRIASKGSSISSTAMATLPHCLRQSTITMPSDLTTKAS